MPYPTVVDRTAAAVLITARARHLNVTRELAGKPVRVVTILGGGRLAEDFLHRRAAESRRAAS